MRWEEVRDLTDGSFSSHSLSLPSLSDREVFTTTSPDGISRPGLWIHERTTRLSRLFIYLSLQFFSCRRHIPSLRLSLLGPVLLTPSLHSWLWEEGIDFNKGVVGVKGGRDSVSVLLIDHTILGGWWIYVLSFFFSIPEIRTTSFPLCYLLFASRRATLLTVQNCLKDEHDLITSSRIPTPSARPMWQFFSPVKSMACKVIRNKSSGLVDPFFRRHWVFIEVTLEPV